MPPGSAASIRPGGHVKEDLVELMMIQNAQMHQVIMSNMTMSALSRFGYCSPPSDARHASGPDQDPGDLVVIQENEADQEIYHHYYQPDPYLSYPAWPLHQAAPVYQDPSDATSDPPHGDGPAAPSPPRPNAAGTAGAGVAPAAGISRATGAGAEQSGE